MSRVALIAAVCWLGSLPALAQERVDDGRRAVNVERFGVFVRCPQAWTLMAWAENDRAFVLKLPQEEGSPLGYVACELGLAPESLEEYRDQHAQADAAEQKKDVPRRKLTENRISEFDDRKFTAEQIRQFGRRLDSLWEAPDPAGAAYELRTRLIAGDILYTFVLSCDEAHFAAYRLDFEEMLASAKLLPPETGLQRLPGGFWMQRDFRFALRLPDGWKPAFGPDDRALLFATGKKSKLFTDNLLVLAGRSQELDLRALREDLPASVKKIDPEANVAACEIVKQAGALALETVIHTQRGQQQITILERRFEGDARNYEVKFTCETAEFKRIEEELRSSLDSFREIAAPSNPQAL